MNFDRHLEELTQWYCQLVKEPAWRDYVLDRVAYMAERQSMYRAMREAVLAADTEALRSGTPNSRP